MADEPRQSSSSSQLPPPQGVPLIPEQLQPPQGVPQVPAQPQEPQGVFQMLEQPHAPHGLPRVLGKPQPPQGVPQSQYKPQLDAVQLMQRKHVHHSYIWLGTIQVALAILVTMFFTLGPAFFLEESSGDALRDTIIMIVALGIGIIIVGATVFIQILSYRNLYYELGDEGFDVYSGILKKKRVHVPYQRIQSVNQKASVIQRIFGVCTITIDTAGGSANKAIAVPYLQNTEAEQLRHELFARKKALLSGGAQTQTAQQAMSVEMISQATNAGRVVPGLSASASQDSHNVLDTPAEMLADVRGVFGSQGVDRGEVSYQFGLSNKELVLTGLSNSTGFVVMVITAVATLVSVVGQLVQTAAGRWAYDNGLSFASQVVSSPTNTLYVVGIAVAALLVIWLLSVIGTCISYGGFKATRRGSRIEVERGLLQHRFQGVDIDRVQSVIIKQSFIRRVFGYCELSLGKIDAMTSDSSSQQQSVSLGLVVHPFVKMTRVPEILAGLVPEFADVPTHTKPVAKPALRRAIVRRGVLTGSGFWLAVLTTAALGIALIVVPAATADENLLEIASFYVSVGVIVLYAVCLILVVIDVIGAVLWYRSSSYAYNRSFMQVTNGGFSRSRVSFPRKKIQYGFTKSNPFQRRAQVKTISAKTAAGIGGTAIKLLDVYEEEANEWLEWVKPRLSIP